ncbi:unnamed protein product [Blepharisma stoltei]|uniref:Uncharacterized protein n=1 Tax=Blepharisma stoltei TaxID=1481888 RepID=A0AAU9IZY9_9CILI|nr:unnamed protein product [Blepharisma stoltei]
MSKEAPVKLISAKKEYVRNMTPGKLTNLNQIQPSHNNSNECLPHPSILVGTKRIYPLNFKVPQDRKLEYFHRRYKSYEEAPEFMHEYMMNPLKPQFEAKSALNVNYSSRQSICNKLHHHERSQSTEPRMNHPISLKVKDFQYSNKNSDNSCYPSKSFYKPHVIYITPRSKITLYSSFPINLKPDQAKPQNLSQMRTRNSSKYSFQDRPGSIMMTQQKAAQPEIFPITKPALTFGEKILRLKELVIDPVVKEQSLI